jgi:hypothetical protein
MPPAARRWVKTDRDRTAPVQRRRFALCRCRRTQRFGNKPSLIKSLALFDAALQSLIENCAR